MVNTRKKGAKTGQTGEAVNANLPSGCGCQRKTELNGTNAGPMSNQQLERSLARFFLQASPVGMLVMKH